jgi:Zn-dependent protease with chaperone function
MNFFQHQDHARRHTRRLVVLFALAVVAIVVVVDFALLLAFGLSGMEQGIMPFSAQGLASNVPLLIGGTAATTSVIGLSSLFKTASLRGGGGKVARELGGTLVDADVRDPLRRRLRNVVEEIALASGVPVPEIYVLEQESGINAFAAGYTPADAAVAVTRGAMEKLSRNELQGVIAHEFSHIFNGDMRLNIRLMGALFGILLLALIGRRVLHSARYMGRSRDSGGGAIIVIALTLTLVGYVGLFFGRWIKSAVSRQREYLADASAVQFTRDPTGISGALKKIAIYSDASYLNAESEEVGHMLFGSGQKMNLFATHPPLMERIQRVEPSFNEEELQTIARRILREEEREARKQAELAEAEAQKQQRGGGAIFDPARFMEQIGNPQWERLLMAAAVAASIPETVKTAAHSADWAPEVLFYSLLDSHPEVRDRQMLIIAQRMGNDSGVRVRGLIGAAESLRPEQRLPLMEVALPSLKRHPPEFVQKVLETVNELIHADGRVDVFEYLLARVVSQYLWEAMNPHNVRNAGRKSLQQMKVETASVLAILARHGHASGEQAEKAYRQGVDAMDLGGIAEMPATDDWIETLDRAIAGLDKLKMADKEILVRGLIETVTADGHLVSAELELLRAVCAMLHVPVPIIPANISETP